MGWHAIRRAVAARRITATRPCDRRPGDRVRSRDSDRLRPRRRAGRTASGSEAIEVPLETQRASRSEVLRPQERMAALLGLRDTPLACEELRPARPRGHAGRPRARGRASAACGARGAPCRALKAHAATARKRTSLRSTSGERPRAMRPTRRSTARCRPSAPPKSERRSAICERVLRRRARASAGKRARR